jgi:flagellar biosynthesis chaperone FliJ
MMKNELEHRNISKEIQRADYKQLPGLKTTVAASLKHIRHLIKNLDKARTVVQSSEPGLSFELRVMRKKLIEQQIVHKGWLFEIQIRMKSFKRMFDKNVLGVVTEG